jgi:hypothetical protein
MEVHAENYFLLKIASKFRFFNVSPGKPKVIERAGLKITKSVQNPEYQYVSRSAIGASKKYEVKSISVLAEKI